MYRVGFGEDIHKTVPGDTVILGGIQIPAPFALSGVSDADVVLHALTDAILGALALGDIGDYFPPSDSVNKNRDSADFIGKAIELMVERDYRLVNADILLLCERPKIGPHKEKMRARIAELCESEIEQISVKATTSERLGFVGREEGICARCVVLLAKSSG